MSTYLVQILRAAVLDGRVYKEIAAESETLFPALAVVVAAGIALGLGTQNETVVGLKRALLMAMAINSVIMGWGLWGFVAYAIGRLIGGKATYRAMVRSLGIVYGPGILTLFLAAPTFGGIFLIIARFWLLAAGLIAVSETHEYGVLRGLLPTILGWYMGLWLLPLVLPRIA